MSQRITCPSILQVIVCGRWINSSELPTVGLQPTGELYRLPVDPRGHGQESLNVFGVPRGDST
ncbi:hypothetical protein HAX54_029900, partial [Datura stramonium]|nr:hypothetical protein [Datura stramonium]